MSHEDSEPIEIIVAIGLLGGKDAYLVACADSTFRENIDGHYDDWGYTVLSWQAIDLATAARGNSVTPTQDNP